MMNTSSNGNCSSTSTPDIECFQEYDHEDEFFEGGFHPRYNIPPIVLAVLIIIINSWVLYLVKTRTHLQTNTNIVLSSFALSDFLTGLVSIPLHVSCDVIRSTRICVASQLALRVTSVSTVSHLFLITLDRYIGIKHSLRYQAIVTCRRTLIGLAFVWFSTLVASLIQLTWIRVEREDVDDENDEVMRHEIRYDITSLVLYVTLPLVFMTIAYVDIFREILRQYRHIKRYNSPGWSDTKRKTHREWRAVATFAAMVIAFIICWLPYFIVRLQYNLGNDYLFELPHTVEYIFIYIRFCTPLLNPCMYIFGKHDFRQAISASRRRLIIQFRSPSFFSSSVKTTTV